ncbi:hypothetical protein mRhiFer1_010092 [Rhinolophus ferrumequinum]|uniref:Uncharacterized protein n=1 Tax=Rhinolophus ferrumequinum TaxID=59479 RepID=A0A7J7XPD3_RHIFE|nr:hypothetical protein mRhiFer1_010092 [Rhinolophus ferrumequinum]
MPPLCPALHAFQLTPDHRTVSHCPVRKHGSENELTGIFPTPCHLPGSSQGPPSFRSSRRIPTQLLQFPDLGVNLAGDRVLGALGAISFLRTPLWLPYLLGLDGTRLPQSQLPTHGACALLLQKVPPCGPESSACASVPPGQFSHNLQKFFVLQSSWAGSERPVPGGSLLLYGCGRRVSGRADTRSPAAPTCAALGRRRAWAAPLPSTSHAPQSWVSARFCPPLGVCEGGGTVSSLGSRLSCSCWARLTVAVAADALIGTPGTPSSGRCDHSRLLWTPGALWRQVAH